MFLYTYIYIMKEKIEIWKTVKNFKDYEISNFGVIKNKNTNKILKQNFNKTNEYIYVNIYNKKLSTVSRSVHRLMAETFLPKIQVNHINGDKSNNTLDNLEWSNGSLNTAHAYKLGLIKSHIGESARNVKLTEEIVLNIRKDKALGIGVTEISKKYNIKLGTISSVYYGKNWKHLLTN